MIINSIRANNILKYESLTINDIPENGQIAVSGANESGKTAIGEIICFALFGRTYSRQPDDIKKIIRWGSDTCSVELSFSVGNDKSYTVIRSLDQSGTHSAELYMTGDQAPFATGPQTVNDTILELCGFGFTQYLDSLYLAQREISAPHSQSETIKAIAGATDLEEVITELHSDIKHDEQTILEIERKRDNLQLQVNALGIQEDGIAIIEAEKNQVQNDISDNLDEITALDEVSEGIQEAGYILHSTSQEFISTGINHSLNEWKHFSDQLTGSVDTIHELCESLETENELCTGGKLKHYLKGFRERLQSFDKVRERASLYRAQLASLLGKHSEHPGRYIEEKPLPEQEKNTSRIVSFTRFKQIVTRFSFIALLLATICSWPAWWLLVQQPDSQYADVLRNIVSQYAIWWQPEYLKWLQPVALVSSVFTIILLLPLIQMKKLLRSSRTELIKVRERINITHERAEFLDQLDDLPFPEVRKKLEALGSDDISSSLIEFISNDGSAFASEETLAVEQRRLMELMGYTSRDLGDLRESIATQSGYLTQLIEEQRKRLERLDKDISDEFARRQESKDLQQEIEETGPTIQQHHDSIQLSKLALKLTSDTCRNIYGRFNGILSKYTESVMPKLTESRYRKMQIDDDLQVKIFSSEKNDFAELDEFSSGTQRQMLLAVRLAMSKALVESAQQGKQFIILDEPFAFFDRERIQNTLKALPSVDKNLSQIWVITQEFDNPDQFDMQINCSRNSDTLKVSG